MKRPATYVVAFTALALAIAAFTQTLNTERKVGPARGGHFVATGQLILPVGETLLVPGRPVDLVVSADGQRVYAKDNRGLVIADADRWDAPMLLREPNSGASMHGIAAGKSGKVYWTTSSNDLAITDASANQPITRRIRFPGPKGEGTSVPCGLALNSREERAYVCLSRNNALAIADFATGTIVKQIPVGVAPYDVVLSPDERRAYVVNWGGRHPKPGERTALSAGTPTLIDRRGIAASGSISEVDLVTGRQLREVSVGLHPSDLVITRDGHRVFVANANSDTVSVLAVSPLRVVETIRVRPIEGLPFGSAPTGLALSEDEKRLYVTLGGNNAVASIRLRGETEKQPSRLEGLVPVGWYPGAVAIFRERLFVANVKGEGPREKREAAGFNSHQHRGSLSRIPIPPPSELRTMTERVLAQARASLPSPASRVQSSIPLPVPALPGDPSAIRHVVYIIKENRTYDQVFGAIGRGNSEPSLCIYGRETTPNHHALADEFVLLDNFYCNGVLSADGHSWVTEGYVTDHLEKSFGGFNRSYTFGDDPLTYASSGFLWDDLLDKGLWVRNYGEFDYAEPIPKLATWTDIYRDWKSGMNRIRFSQNIGVERIRKHSCRAYPGWNMKIPDVLRASVFLKELGRFEKQGRFPNLVLLYLPNDHTSGTDPSAPTPRAQVADNDLALGRLVESLSKSRFWKRMAIFVVEDDPQDGFDHVDGHRSLCLVISPYSRLKGLVISNFYNQTSVVRTIRQILGFGALNQIDQASPLMRACFAGKLDPAPYRCRPNRIPLDEMNPSAKKLSGQPRYWAEKSRALPLNRPDQADEETLNRILWHAAKGYCAPYPKEWAGAHGRGLAALGLSAATTTLD